MSNNTLGVPQGSVLAPVHFFYNNDMYRSLNQMSFVDFADDTSFFIRQWHINKVHATVNSELAWVNNWLKANRLSLNVSKTSYNNIVQPEKRFRRQNSRFDPSESSNSQIPWRYTWWISCL